MACLIAALAPAACADLAAAPDGGGERTAGAPEPIQDGYPDSVDEAVVGIAQVNDEGRAARICSGTFIAPNLVLTAQHCVAGSPSRISCATARFSSTVDPARLRVAPCDDIHAQCTWLRVREVLRPPDDDAVCGNDIALVVLATPVPDDQVAPLSLRLDDPPEEGESYSAVGFGRTAGDAYDSGSRRRRDGLEVACVGPDCGAPGRTAHGEWQGGSGACKGDSGGPALDEAGDIIGVDSRGSVTCDRPVYSGLTAHRDWLVAAGARAARLGAYAAPGWAAGEARAATSR